MEYKANANVIFSEVVFSATNLTEMFLAYSFKLFLCLPRATQTVYVCGLLLL